MQIRVSVLSGLCLWGASVSVACGSDTEPVNPPPSVGTARPAPSGAGGGVGAPSTTGTTPTPAAPSPTTAQPTPTTSAPLPTPSGTTSPPPAASGDGLPCEVRKVVQASCANCHGSSPRFGAPMALAKAADFRQPGVAAHVLERVADDAHPMPPEPYARLSSAEQAALKSWLDSGAQDVSCSGTGNNPTPPNPDPVTQPQDPSVKCYSLTARDNGGTAKYSVPTTKDLYQCFQYALPWGSKKVQIVSAKPIIDNDKVLHHWILYNNTGSVRDGTNASCVGAHPDAANVAGWAPGGSDMVLPPDVGLRVEPGGFTLEVHYNNSLGAGQTDASGVEVCVTDQLRKNEAAVHWLGTQSLNKVTATGTCTPANQGDVTIISATPHMHLQGRHMKTVINRKGGGSEVLLDKPFDFNTQVSYPVSAVVKPGDTLTTTCTFATPTPFGQGTNQEMCYNFVLAYPAGDLAQAIQLLRKYDCTGL